MRISLWGLDVRRCGAGFRPASAQFATDGIAMSQLLRRSLWPVTLVLGCCIAGCRRPGPASSTASAAACRVHFDRTRRTRRKIVKTKSRGQFESVQTTRVDVLPRAQRRPCSRKALPDVPPATRPYWSSSCNSTDERRSEARDERQGSRRRWKRLRQGTSRRADNGGLVDHSLQLRTAIAQFDCRIFRGRTIHIELRARVVTPE